VRKVFTVGFCMGGRQSWLAAAGGHGLAGAVGFYGRPGPAQDGAPGPAQLAERIEAPVLALQAGADQNITADQNEAFEQALSGAGVEHELVVYEGAPHSFFDRKQEEFAAASDDAWQRTLDFVDRHS
jgi:carboxymethylenebutenolidase